MATKRDMLTQPEMNNAVVRGYPLNNVMYAPRQTNARIPNRPPLQKPIFISLKVKHKAKFLCIISI